MADDNHLRSMLGYRDDVRAVLDLGASRPVAWAVRPSNPKLLEALNRFLDGAKLRHFVDELHTGDLESLRERKVLRVLTRNSSSTYFLHRGELLGFEYELARRFAKGLGLQMVMVVPPEGDDLLTWLREGRGDVVAAGLTETPTRQAIEGVAWSKPTDHAHEVLVKRASDPLQRLEQLAGRTVVVRRSSAYWSTVQALQGQGIDVTLVEAPESLVTSEIIDRVAQGEYDLTVADSLIFEIEQTYRDDVAKALVLTEDQPLGWAVREGNPELLRAANAFLAAEVGGVFYNVIHRRYFSDERNIREKATERVAQGGELTPFDALIQVYSARYGFDWRLVAAQMYQESHFDPEARSWSGAQGLLQVMPRTAAEHGFHDRLSDPEVGVHAGVTYLSWVRDRFEPELDPQERLWFTLASYNAGFGHVSDARDLAMAQGLDRNRWFGHTEQAMLLLSRPQYSRRARYGFVRGTEPVNYVRRIRERYGAYVEATGAR